MWRLVGHEGVHHRLFAQSIEQATRLVFAVLDFGVFMIARAQINLLSGTPMLSGCHRRGPQQVRYSQQRIAAEGQCGHEADLGTTGDFQFAQWPTVLAPAKAFLDMFADSLTHPVNDVSGGTAIERGIALTQRLHRLALHLVADAT